MKLDLRQEWASMRRDWPVFVWVFALGIVVWAWPYGDSWLFRGAIGVAYGALVMLTCPYLKG
jgi:hypothetical protein